MNNKNHKECNSCFFSEKFPSVIIEKNGSCNFCSSDNLKIDNNLQTSLNLTELQNIAKELKKKRKGKYDCIIGASGGLDSSFVIYIAKKMLDLNPLVIKYDHGFNYSISDNNLKTICNNLSVDLKIIKSAKQNDINYVRFLVLALRDIDIYTGVCMCCQYALPAVIYKYALKENISTILTSSNSYEDSLHLNRVSYNPFRKFIFTSLQKYLFKFNLMKLVNFIFFMSIARFYYLIKLRLELYVPPIKNIFRGVPEKPSTIEVLNISNYIKWDIDKMAKTMEKEIGWKTPGKPQLPMRFDCKIEHSLGNYTWKKVTGITTHGIFCNNLIYSGIKNKGELIETYKYYDTELNQRMKEMFHELKIKSDTLK